MTRFPIPLPGFVRRKSLAWAGGFVVVVIAVVALLTWQPRAVSALITKRTPAPDAAPKADLPRAENVRRVGADTLVVPVQAAAKMGLRTAVAVEPTRPRKLPPFQGTLAIDTDRLVRVHSRFPGEVVELGDPGRATDADHANSPGHKAADRLPHVHVGDHVRKGNLLAVVWSKELGEKKSELVDALSKLKADEVTLSRLQDLYKTGAGSERAMRDAEREVQTAKIAVGRIERTLQSWRMTDKELAAVRAEADKLAAEKPGAKVDVSDSAAWARVEIRAPIDGVILEKNVAVGDIADTSADLFKVGDLSHLMVWAHVYEEDLPVLQSLPAGVPWTVSFPSRPGVELPGRLGNVGAMIDPSQHTALVTGEVANPNGELKAGQTVAVTVELPPPAGEVEVPAESVIEDGRTSAVIVQHDATGQTFSRKTVKVARRFRDAIYIIVEPNGVKPGDRVVTGSALLLNNALNELPETKQ